jgi:hypothetical protein
MKYALLIYLSPDAPAPADEDEARRITAEYLAIRDDPRVYDGGHLAGIETATTVRVPNGRTLTTDGPFAETREVFAGYYLVEADDLDQAVELAGRVPAARTGGSVEIRPFMEGES